MWYNAGLGMAFSFQSLVAALSVDLSIVVALFNEAPNLELLYDEITAALSPTGLRYEMILVDDGSSDGSFDVLQKLHQRDPQHVRVIRLRRNFGQTAAWAAGFDAVRGDMVVTMDADLQNDPADIPALVAKLDEGYELVNGWRAKRKDRLLDRRLPSLMGNLLVSRVTRVKLHDYGCSLRAFKSDLLPHIELYGEMHRYLPALVVWAGARMTEVAVNHRPRKYGESKYGLGRTWRVLLDLMTLYFLRGYAGSPMRLFGGMGLLFSVAGVGIGGYLSSVKLILGEDIGNRPLLLLAILLIVLGVQFIMMGLLAELSVRIYYESQDKPIYIVRERLDKSAP